MHAAPFFAAVAALASAANAVPFMTPRQANGTGWGSWTVTGAKSSYDPSGSHRSLDFYVQYQSQAKSIHCTAYFPGSSAGVGPDQAYTPCEDQSVSFTSDYGIGTIWLSQKLYQVGAIAHLNGSAPLNLYGGNCTVNAVGGGTCYGASFTVPVTSTSTELPGNRTT